MSDNFYQPRLIADIGGTNARFALQYSAWQLTCKHSLATSDYPTLAAAIQHYLQQAKVQVNEVVIAIANPVTDDWVKMTNHHWQFSISTLQAELGVKTLLLINDFTAQALAVTRFGADDCVQIGGQITTVPPQNSVAVLGAGTGLGVSGLIPDGRGKMLAISGEGGHVSFSPRDALERRLLAFAEKELGGGHVSIERILCGDGLMLLYRFFVNESGGATRFCQPADITHAAVREKDSVCVDVLSRYCMILGDFSANVALTLGAAGGVYIGGGIVPRFIDFLTASKFRSRFEDKGRFADYLQSIPVYIVTHPSPGLLGASVALHEKLQHQTDKP